MGRIDSRTFNTDEGVALRLPDEIAFAPGTRVTIERNGDTLTIRPVPDQRTDKARLIALVEALRELPVAGVAAEREPIELPDRPGLY